MDIRHMTQKDLQELIHERMADIDFTFGYNKVFKEYCEERANVIGITWQEYMAEEQTKEFLRLYF